MTEKKYPSQLAERFQIRLPDGLRDRIRASAATNNRSMNAEIVNALEFAFPEPPKIEETIADIKRYAEGMRHFKGPAMLNALADSLDQLMLDISRDPSIDEDTRQKARKFAEDYGKFTRFVPPED
ncbi:hypothetical protein B5M44_19190 [Shinella sumterensis]|jgi:plasmid stability protein|uniref:Arc family DNA-binding protein n=1 Tax=Shinella sumterensis TaxID=1967501 RepID=UPI00106E0CA1|nr:Arc family DNA-binding protein [Shinella sumterensis]MCD1266075.1 Arc family DNA-binding protein [Shinella sumterensis]TFE96564.1 hypothetical protein B5M44_19190 [Shinella sumterensis]